MIFEEEFCRIIEKDYTYYMYKSDHGYPYNCHTSANLISSYLSVHFNNEFIHRTQKNSNCFHGWTKGREICIDFTGIQFSLDTDFNNKKYLNEDEFYELTQKHRIKNPIIIRENMDDWYDTKVDILSIEPLHGIKYARKVNNPYCIENFIAYIEEAFEEVDKKVRHCYGCL